ncbi:aldo/keto reductase [Marinicrinis sediminis]|uniref:Aldo/keto reductase n=1 Tax=Marinicrinis sediminis TaxID=1652465 RepID=A0ABW5RDS2_9BACL
MPIPKNQFGKMTKHVTKLGFGAGHIGDPAQMDDRTAEQLLHSVLDEGINLIDTARGYGISEERIGQFISHRRDEYVLSTKVGYGIDGFEDWTGACVEAGVDRALKVMKTDYLDIVHLHSCPVETLKQGDVIEALLKMAEQGKVINAAYSGENEALDWAVQSKAFASIQCSINIADQQSIRQVLPETIAQGLGVIAKRPLANAPWRYSEQPVGEYCETYWLRLKEMGLAPGELSWNELALRFTAFTEGVHTCIVGSSKLSHIREHIANIQKGPLDANLYAAVRQSFEKVGADWKGEI